MCGICGIFSYSSNSIVDKDELVRIRDHMISRGPDGFGISFSKNNRLAFGHRRLSILDLSDNGLQPMVDESTGTKIVFNGEIYNYLELKIGLECKGIIFRTGTDTEVLLKLYQVYGKKMVQKIRGMYAFAIWDAVEHELFIARDPLGIKPLYYANVNGKFYFASQVKALLHGANFDKSPSEAGHVGFFIWGSVPEPFTMFNEIKALPAGCSITVSYENVEGPVLFDSPAKRLTSTNIDVKFESKQEAIKYIAQEVKETVAAHLVSDVQVGLFLSAGLDSYMIAAAASNIRSLKSVTLDFNEYQNTFENEAQYADLIAAKLNINHKSIMIKHEEFDHNIDQIMQHMDQPSIDGINTWFVAKAAKENGLKVALSGLGGDEIFGSYPSFVDIPRMVKLLRIFSNFPKFGVYTRKKLSKYLGANFSPKYAGLFEYGGSYSGAYLLRRSLYMPWELPEFLSNNFIEKGLRELAVSNSLNKHIEDSMATKQIVSSLEMGCYMRNTLLRDADWAGMAHSVEIRTPFVDTEFITKISPIVSKYKDITKADVAYEVNNLMPSDFYKRKKTGFTVPVRNWIKEDDDKKKPTLKKWAHTLYQNHMNNVLI